MKPAGARECGTSQKSLRRQPLRKAILMGYMQQYEDILQRVCNKPDYQ